MILPRRGSWSEHKGWFMWERMEHRDCTPSILCKVTLRDYAAEDAKRESGRAQDWGAFLTKLETEGLETPILNTSLLVTDTARSASTEMKDNA